MADTVFKLAFLLAALLTARSPAGGATFLMPAQEPSNAEAAPNIVLGGGSGAPGDAVVVPIYYTPPEGVEAGRLKLGVSFVSANLKYLKVERGLAAEITDVNVTGTLVTGKNEKDVETSTLSISIAAPSGENQKGIPPGLLAYVSLRISESGRPAVITLRTTTEAAELNTNRPLDSIRAADATVEVIAPGSEPAVNCFFFTH